MIAKSRFVIGEPAPGDVSVIRTVTHTAKQLEVAVTVLARRIASAAVKNGFLARGARAVPDVIV